jgi:hypothetical protein
LIATKFFQPFSVANPKYKAVALLKTYELFLYGDIHDVTNLFCDKALEVATTQAGA